jgi:hypothetical protein
MQIVFKDQMDLISILVVIFSNLTTKALKIFPPIRS